MYHNTVEKCNVLWNVAGRPKTAENIQSVLGHTRSKRGVTRSNSLYEANLLYKRKEHSEYEY